MINIPINLPIIIPIIQFAHYYSKFQLGVFLHTIIILYLLQNIIIGPPWQVDLAGTDSNMDSKLGLLSLTSICAWHDLLHEWRSRCTLVD